MKNIFNRQYELPAEYKFQLIKNVKKTISEKKFFDPEFINSLITLVAFELGLRPIQIYAINVNDLFIYENAGEKYYSLTIQNVKKISNNDKVKKQKAISTFLGKNIEKLISHKPFEEGESALFIDKNCKRLSTHKLAKIIKDEIIKTGFDFDSFGGNNILRHNLAQALADQGSPAEVISEVLGHNSTVAARAYIAATPQISEIKTRSLGKSERFKEILEMLETGEPRKKDEVPEERWIQGVVGNGFIGGIGGCGLPSHAPCPKNPVYSCYTCQKFHPFQDGPHNDVLEKLRKEAQEFIDNSLNSGDFKFNRTLEQLELTIESVQRTVNLFKTD